MASSGRQRPTWADGDVPGRRVTPIGSAPVALSDTQPSGASEPLSAPSAPAPSPSPMTPPPVPDLPPRWPSVVRAELLARHAELADRVAATDGARLLDLSLPAGRHVLADVLAGGTPPADAVGVDVVLSVAGLTRFPDLGAAVAALASLLSPAGELLLVEPAFRPGITGLAVSSIGALLPPARGVHLARDVPDTVRSVGFTITDLRRFTLPTIVWPLRQFVSLRAVRITADAPTSDEPHDVAVGQRRRGAGKGAGKGAGAGKGTGTDKGTDAGGTS